MTTPWGADAATPRPENRRMWIYPPEPIAMEGVEPVATLPRAPRRSRPRVLRDLSRSRIRTTPGRLVLLSALVVAGAVAFGVIASIAEHSRARAAQAVRVNTEPQLLQAVKLYTSLSDANATATTTFLKGGLEPPATHAHYLQELGRASAALTALAKGTGASSPSVALIVQQLPVYTGLVEAARANNRQGLPIGAAYLRQASSLLTSTILPEADRLYAIETRRLSDDYNTASASTPLIVLAVAVALALGLLLIAQVYVLRVSRRILNIPLVAGTVLLAVVSIWALAALVSEQNAIARARLESDSVGVLSATRVLLSRAQSDQSLTLVNRGSDETDPLDFVAVERALAPGRGLLGEVMVLARSTSTVPAADRLLVDFRHYHGDAARTASLEATGRMLQAMERVSSEGSGAVAESLKADVARYTASAQSRFASAASDATGSLSPLAVAIPVLTVLAAGLALFGLRQRLSEYR